MKKPCSIFLLSFFLVALMTSPGSGQTAEEIIKKAIEAQGGKKIFERQSGILIVHDEDDETIPYADSREVSRQFKHISLHTTHGLGHKRILFDSATINWIVDHIRSNIDGHLFSKPPKTQEEPIMPSSIQIIEEYKTADFEKRLYLFLECPGLREDFIHIDRDESETDFKGHTTSQRKAF